MKAPWWVEEEITKCFGENVVRTDRIPIQNSFYVTHMVGLTCLSPWALYRSASWEERLLDLGVHGVEDSIKAVPVRQERVILVECL